MQNQALILIFIFSFILNSTNHAQNAYLYKGENKPCPEKLIEYSIKVQYYDDGSYHNVSPSKNKKWGITNGTIVNGGDADDSWALIKWNDNGKNGSFLIEGIQYFTDEGARSAPDFSMSVQIYSLSGIKPENLAGATDIKYNSTSQIHYIVDTIKYSNNMNITKYNWTFPSGWQHEGKVSDGISEFTTNSPSITVIPDYCMGGSVKVRGINSECQGNESTLTDSLRIIRSWPDYSITGTNEICNLDSFSYYIDIPTNLSINWITSSNISISSPQGSNPCYFTKNGNDGPGYIDAELTLNGCNTTSTAIRKKIWVGKPTSDKIVYYNVGPYYPGLNSICLDNSNDGKALFDNPQANILEYEWNALDWIIVQHPNDPFPQIEMQDVQISAPPYGYSIGDHIYFTIRARNQCGWSDWKYPKLELECVNCGFFRMTIFPNPADSYVDLSFEPLSDENPDVNNKIVTKSNNVIYQNTINGNVKLSHFTVQIIDNQGNIRKNTRVSNQNQKLRINTEDLESGIYYIHLISDKTVYKHQLIIN